MCRFFIFQNLRISFVRGILGQTMTFRGSQIRLNHTAFAANYPPIMPLIPTISARYFVSVDFRSHRRRGFVKLSNVVRFTHANCEQYGSRIATKSFKDGVGSRASRILCLAGFLVGFTFDIF